MNNVVVYEACRLQPEHFDEFGIGNMSRYWPRDRGLQKTDPALRYKTVRLVTAVGPFFVARKRREVRSVPFRRVRTSRSICFRDNVVPALQIGGRTCSGG